MYLRRPCRSGYLGAALDTELDLHDLGVGPLLGPHFGRDQPSGGVAAGVRAKGIGDPGVAVERELSPFVGLYRLLEPFADVDEETNMAGGGAVGPGDGPGELDLLARRGESESARVDPVSGDESDVR